MRSKKIAQSLNRSKIVNDFRAIQALCRGVQGVAGVQNRTTRFGVTQSLPFPIADHSELLKLLNSF